MGCWSTGRVRIIRWHYEYKFFLKGKDYFERNYLQRHDAGKTKSLKEEITI